MLNVKIHNFSSDLSTTYPRFGDKLIIMGGKHVNTHITRCTRRTDTMDTINCVRGRKTPKSEEKKVNAGEKEDRNKNIWKILEKEFDCITLTRYNANRDYIALYLAREQ